MAYFKGIVIEFWEDLQEQIKISRVFYPRLKWEREGLNFLTKLVKSQTSPKTTLVGMSKLFMKMKRESMVFLLDFILRRFPDCRFKNFFGYIVDKMIIFAPIKLVGAGRKT